MQKHVTQQQKNSQTGTSCILAGRGVLFGDFFFLLLVLVSFAFI